MADHADNATIQEGLTGTADAHPEDIVDILRMSADQSRNSTTHLIARFEQHTKGLMGPIYQHLKSIMDPMEENEDQSVTMLHQILDNLTSTWEPDWRASMYKPEL